MAAAEKGHTAIVQLLIQHKAQVNAAMQVLQVKKILGFIIVRFEISEIFFDMNTVHSLSGLATPFKHFIQYIAPASYQNYFDPCCHLCFHHQDGRTGLMAAAFGGHEAVVQLMIEHKAEVNATDQVPQAWKFEFLKL